MKLDQVLVVHSIKGCKTTGIVANALDDQNIGFEQIHRSRLNKKFFNKNDLVIVVGGDGTFLRTSHFVLGNTPMLGVNCDPMQNEGFFMRSNAADFKSKLSRLLAGNNRTRILNRLQVKLGSKILPELALNDVYLGDKRAYHMSRYWLNGEYQKSSGVIVATPAGSHAWYKSSGGKPLSLSSANFIFHVREPFRGRLTHSKTVAGVLSKNKHLAIKSDNFQGIIIFDSVSREYPFPMDAIAKISLSNKPLTLVEF